MVGRANWFVIPLAPLRHSPAELASLVGSGQFGVAQRAARTPSLTGWVSFQRAAGYPTLHRVMA